MAAYQGLRCQEIAGFDREDVLGTREQPVIVVVHGKCGYQRIIALHPEVLSALRCLPMPRSGPLFSRPRGGRYPAAQLSYGVNQWLHGHGPPAPALVRDRDLCPDA
jgi:integrase/recombinase XerC